MSKAYLVLNQMPTSCSECPVHNANMCMPSWAWITYPKANYSRADFCQLREQPEKALEWDGEPGEEFSMGYNTAIREIFGNEEAIEQ